MGIIDNAKKAVVKTVTRITDEMYRNKWDGSSVNMALFAEDDPNKPVPPKKDTGKMSFEEQIRERNKLLYDRQGEPSLAPEIAYSTGKPRVKGTDPEGVAPAPGTPVNAASAVNEQSEGYVKPVFRSRFSGWHVTSSVASINNSLAASNLPAMDLAQADFNSVKPQEETAPVAEEETLRCYYVLITHRNSYPTPGSKVMMRSCDHQYVWTDQISEDLKPEYTSCKHCGRQICHIETDMD
ncbi:MAG: hypothetical protein J6X66_09825 [Lachnospiraceae bacterium]|nr:hypothetical protein [Lachnospiraceae bacterium]